jgi:uncharacterized protein YegJ (DUF2314 family)
MADARFTLIRNDNRAVVEAARRARASIPQLKALFESRRPGVLCSAKLRVKDPKLSAKESEGSSFYLWLAVVAADDRGFTGEVFDVPKPVAWLSVGDTIPFRGDEVFDWMVNDGGHLVGGLTLRLQRAALHESRRAEYDEYVGVTSYEPEVDPIEEYDDDLVAVFVPSLVVLLSNLEKGKGAPLTEDEVVGIRDSGTCVMLRRPMARAQAKARGYEDLDPENIWEEWQRVRATLEGSGQ